MVRRIKRVTIVEDVPLKPEEELKLLTDFFRSKIHPVRRGDLLQIINRDEVATNSKIPDYIVDGCYVVIIRIDSDDDINIAWVNDNGTDLEDGAYMGITQCREHLKKGNLKVIGNALKKTELGF